MKNKNRWIYPVSAMFFLTCAANVLAADANSDFSDISNVGDSETGNQRLKRWEFGLEIGQARPIGSRMRSIVADNSAFLFSDPGELGEDEFAENGLVSPDFSGKTTIIGDTPNFLVGGFHLYYSVASWFSAGLVTLHGFERALNITSGGPFTSVIYDTKYRMHTTSAIPVLRVGPWIGPLRPYVAAGVGPYYVSETVTSELVDIDDPDHPPVKSASKDRFYVAAHASAGLDVRIFSGILGVCFAEEKAFTPGSPTQFFIPTLTFSTEF
jgi:hypothetical protein